MILKEETKKFSLEVVNWLTSKSEWKLEGGQNPCKLSKKLAIVESWFDIPTIKIFRILRKDETIGFVKIDFADRIYFHLYVIKEKRKKGFGYFVVKQIFKKYESDERKVATLVKPRTKNFKLLKDSMLMNPTKEKIQGYTIFERI